MQIKKSGLNCGEDTRRPERKITTLAILLVSIVVADIAVSGGAPDIERKATQWKTAPLNHEFYNPPIPLPPGKPGDLIWAEEIEAPAGAQAWKVLYHSRSFNGNPIAVSGWVVTPKTKLPEGKKRSVVAWAHGSMGLADKCAPTKGPFDQPTVTNRYPIPMLEKLLQAGYVITASDYEGLGTPGLHLYGVSQSETRSVLDNVRVSQQLPTMAGSQVIVYGESQGGRVTIALNETAANYAPDINLQGVISSGTAVPQSVGEHNKFMIETRKGGVLMMGLAAQLAAHGEPARAAIEAYLTKLGQQELTNAASGCLHDVIKYFAQFEPYDLFSRDFIKQDSANSHANSGPGNRGGTAPLLLVHGMEDEFIPPEHIIKWKDKACSYYGMPIELKLYPNTGHSTFDSSEDDILLWMESRFSGKTPTNHCTKFK